MTVHNYRSRQVHETLKRVNPSSSFRDVRSAKSGPNLWQIWQVFGPWASPYGANGHMCSVQCTPTGLDNSTELRMEKIHWAVAEIWVPQVWQPPARPPGPWRQYPSSPEGWGVKSDLFTTMPLTRLVFALSFQNGMSQWHHFCFASKYRQDEPQYQCGGSCNDVIACFIKFLWSVIAQNLRTWI